MREAKLVQVRFHLRNWQVPVVLREMHQRRDSGVITEAVVKRTEQHLLRLLYRTTQAHLVATGISSYILQYLDTIDNPREDADFEGSERHTSISYFDCVSGASTRTESILKPQEHRIRTSDP
jgi:hypothetical protein